MVEWEYRTNPREASGLDPEAVHDAHPHIRYEDALELAVIVETPPLDSSTAEAIEFVVADICSHLDEWNHFKPPALPRQA